MRIALLLLCASCGGPTADEHPVAATPTVTASAPETKLDPPAPAIPAECTGSDIDVSKAIGSPACQGASLPGTTIDALNRLVVKVTPPAKVAPGAHADIDVTLTNDSDAAMSLRLLPFPWSAVTKTSMGPHPCGTAARGAAILDQLGELHTPASSAPAGRIVIPPKGVAHAKIAWEANGKKWGPASNDKGTCKADPVAGPLASGTYSVTVRVPAVGVTIPEQAVSIVVGN